MFSLTLLGEVIFFSEKNFLSLAFAVNSDSALHIRYTSSYFFYFALPNPFTQLFNKNHNSVYFFLRRYFFLFYSNFFYIIYIFVAFTFSLKFPLRHQYQFRKNISAALF